MEHADRDYYFLSWTLHTADRSCEQAAEWLDATVRPAWEELIAAGWLIDGRALWRLEDVETPQTPIDWTVTLFAEIAEGRDPHQASAAEQAALGRRGFFDDSVRVLGGDITRRESGLSTPTPRPSPRLPRQPAGWCPAVIHVDYPAEHAETGRAATRRLHGPVAQIVVDRGEAYRIAITEVVATRARDAATPTWNHLNIVDGDWDGGFEAAIRRTVPQFFDADEGLQTSVESAHALMRMRQVSRCSEISSVAV